MSKMTYVVAIDRAIAGDIDTEVIEKLEALKAQTIKRGSGKHGLTKTQKEGLDLKDKIAEMLEDAPDGMTATEVGTAMGMSCQRASALLAQMGDPNGKVKGDGRVRKDKVGKQVRFYLADEGFYDEVEDEVEGE